MIANLGLFFSIFILAFPCLQAATSHLLDTNFSQRLLVMDIESILAHSSSSSSSDDDRSVDFGDGGGGDDVLATLSSLTSSKHASTKASTHAVSSITSLQSSYDPDLERLLRDDDNNYDIDWEDYESQDDQGVAQERGRQTFSVPSPDDDDAIDDDELRRILEEEVRMRMRMRMRIRMPNSHTPLQHQHI